MDLLIRTPLSSVPPELEALIAPFGTEAQDLGNVDDASVYFRRLPQGMSLDWFAERICAHGIGQSRKTVEHGLKSILGIPMVGNSWGEWPSLQENWAIDEYPLPARKGPLVDQLLNHPDRPIWLFSEIYSETIDPKTFERAFAMEQSLETRIFSVHDHDVMGGLLLLDRRKDGITTALLYYYH